MGKWRGADGSDAFLLFLFNEVDQQKAQLSGKIKTVKPECLQSERWTCWTLAGQGGRAPVGGPGPSGKVSF